jgi:hypothetical protein
MARKNGIAAATGETGADDSQETNGANGTNANPSLSDEQTDGSGQGTGDTEQTFDDLFDDEQDDDGDEQGDEQQDDGGRTVVMTPEQIADLVERAIDRRINERLQRRMARQSGGVGMQQGTGQAAPTGQAQQTSPTLDRTALREARAAYRDVIGEQMRFIGPDEREAARKVAEGLIATRLGTVEDPYDLGEQVAREVAEMMTGLREFYKQKTVGALRRKGVLPEQQGQPSRGAPKTSASSWKAGEERARQLRPERFAQQQS